MIWPLQVELIVLSGYWVNSIQYSTVLYCLQMHARLSPIVRFRKEQYNSLQKDRCTSKKVKMSFYMMSTLRQFMPTASQSRKWMSEHRNIGTPCTVFPSIRKVDNKYHWLALAEQKDDLSPAGFRRGTWSTECPCWGGGRGREDGRQKGIFWIHATRPFRDKLSD
jgi:hypothetical protein